jgi:hypothetical protein
VVVGEDRARPVTGGAGCLQVVGGAVNGVGFVVDVRRLSGRIAACVDLDPVPGVAGGSADPDLHRPGGSGAVGAGVHAGECGGVERGLDVVDRGEDGWAAVPEGELRGGALEDWNVGRRDPADRPAKHRSLALRLGCADSAQREHHRQQREQDREREREQPQPSHRGSRLQPGDQPAAVQLSEGQQERAGVGPILL